jgi:hypothetical protein
MSERKVEGITKEVLENAVVESCTMAEIVHSIFGIEIPYEEYHAYAEETVEAIIKFDLKLDWKHDDPKSEKMHTHCRDNACAICDIFHINLNAAHVLVTSNTDDVPIAKEVIIDAFRYLVSEVIEHSYNGGDPIVIDSRTLEDQILRVQVNMDGVNNDFDSLSEYGCDMSHISTIPADVQRQIIIEELQVGH